MTLHAFLLCLHLLAATVWVGGMFFAHVCLRPAALQTLEPPQRLALWQALFARFFPWVNGAIATLILTGGGMMHRAGSGNLPPAWQLMATIGLVMTAIYLSIRLGPYRRFGHAQAVADLAAAAKAQGEIRRRIFVNLMLGLVTLIVATLGMLL